MKARWICPRIIRSRSSPCRRRTPAAAEKEYAKSLEANPGQAEVSYSLGNAILAQKKPERQPEVLFHWARAASLKGPGALPPDKQKTIDTFFVKQYNALSRRRRGRFEVAARIG